MIEITPLGWEETDKLPTVSRLMEMASEDLDSFWRSLTRRERGLTCQLVPDDCHDQVVIVDGVVYVLSLNADNFNYGACRIGPEEELKLFFNVENTGLNPDLISDFVQEMAREFPYLECLEGQSESGGVSNLEWLTESYKVEQAIERAMADLL
jgi:hypothetical protein